MWESRNPEASGDCEEPVWIFASKPFNALVELKGSILNEMFGDKLKSEHMTSPAPKCRLII